MRRRDVVAAASGAVVATVLAGSVAWAAIPGDGGVYTACMLKNVGTVRLIDKSLPPGNLMSHCKPSIEAEISWSRQGPQGLQGIQGPPGPQGEKGAQGDPGTLAFAGRSCASGSFVSGFNTDGELVCGSPPGGDGGGEPGDQDLLVSPSQLTFPVTQVGALSDPLSVTLTNTGQAIVSVPIALTGANAPDFLFDGECSAVPAQGTCDLMVRFAPTEVGPRTAQIILQRPNGETVTVTVSGDGAGP